MFLIKRCIAFRRNRMKFLYKEAHILRLYVDLTLPKEIFFERVSTVHRTTSSRAEILTPLRMSLK